MTRYRVVLIVNQQVKRRDDGFGDWPVRLPSLTADHEKKLRLDAHDRLPMSLANVTGTIRSPWLSVMPNFIGFVEKQIAGYSWTIPADTRDEDVAFSASVASGNYMYRVRKLSGLRRAEGLRQINRQDLRHQLSEPKTGQMIGNIAAWCRQDDSQ